MPPKRFARFLSSSSVSRPQRRQRVGETPEQFRKAAEDVKQQLNQFLPPRAPDPPPPPPPEWADIVGNNEHEWIDDHQEEPLVEGDHQRPNRQRRYRTYFDKRQDYFKVWGQLENQFAATYLYCQHTTKNWTSATLNTYLGIRPPGCSCTSQDLCDVDLIDLIDAIQLLHQGYIASSPSTPRTAFSIRLIEHYHSLWLAGGLSKGAFIEGLLISVSARNRNRLSVRGLQEKTRALRVQENDVIMQSTANIPVEGAQVRRWLSARMKQAISSAQKSQTLLTNLYTIPNPHKPGQKYTEEYFLEQWAAERKAVLDPKAQQEAQKLELGKLLCDEEEMDLAWKTVVRTPEQAIARARLLGDLQKQIENQKKKIGTNRITDGLQQQHMNLFLKVWYAKTAVRRLYLSIKEEKRPLEVVQQVGMATKLGTHGEQKVLAAIRARAAKLRPALDIYNRHLAAFKAAFPDRVAPKAMDYKELLASNPEDQFWNDGLFNYEDEPWAFDTPTQAGMRALARLRRCNEEKRRLRWETRRLMRWTTQQFQQLQDLLLRLGNHINAGQDLATDARLKSFMESPALTKLAPNKRRITVTVLVSKQFHRLCQLYHSWNTPVLEVFQMGFQAGDDALARAWHYQMAQVTYLQTNDHSSMIPGDFEGVIDGIIAFCNITSDVPGVPNVAGGLADKPNENDEDDWELDIEDFFERDLHLEEIDIALNEIALGEDDV
ncbi:uncharacterized protein MELLADRAFT_114135 [Melampsora larici-populina 98AG31]|uniref:CxC1-like cysteine cluster associated with KDZ transposases domain-containing protein n=1 Tax=Melampsora larici-populina (strain 98AG31 / pathotype 3-4-7) TaxID=747676 RepID=F4SCA3_MELLP|nr:uncharacterized protein MELLADRAFT_114135 [Melampsora larici-populina 98AG31]EGF97727.1 hypothetical protein MELLADRAFT_114135 [Melampsora larici-populina 98AG31]